MRSEISFGISFVQSKCSWEGWIGGNDSTPGVRQGLEVFIFFHQRLIAFIVQFVFSLLVKVILRCFILFHVIVNGIVFLISFSASLL